jgi:hypothetical protein
MHDLSQGKYDIRVTMGPSFATQRQEAAQSLIQFIQAVPQAGQVAADLIAKNMDWPGAEELAERLKRLLPPGMDEDAPPPPPNPLEQIQLQTAQVNLERIKMEAAKTASEAGYTQARTQSEYADIDREDAVASADAAKSEAEVRKIAAETAKLVTDILIQQGVIGDPARVNVST